MKIELRKIHYSETFSQETSAYTADVYADGKLLGHARNDGNGGCDMLYPAKGRTNSDIEAVNEAVKKERGVEKVDLGDGHYFNHQIDLESVCHELLEAHLKARDEKREINRFKRDLSSRVIFVEAGKVMQTRKIPTDKFEATKQGFKTKYPNCEILNELPFEQAFAKFKKLATAAAR